MSLANSLSQAGKMNELASWNSRLFKLWGLKQETCKVSTASASKCLFMCESIAVRVCVSHAADLAAVTLFFIGVGRRMDLFQSLNLPHALTFMWWMCYFIKHTFTHCAYVPHGPWSLRFLEGSRMVYERLIYSMMQRVCVHSVLWVLWSRQLSFILLKTYTELYGFRDTMSDLHLAEHK